ncbi:MAG: hypothetical protein L6435_02455 [Anaerolineae bacterium]|nr:hypothetical protein [Anaerolineae bacterium]
MIQYPWYDVIYPDQPLQQGDFIDSCPVIVPSEDIKPGEANAEVLEYNVVVMSQSCDLDPNHRKVDLVLVCPVWPLSLMAQNSSAFKGKGQERLKRGEYPGYHLLNSCDLEGFEREPSVVEFRNVYGVPYAGLVRLCRNRCTRIRLLPPYREHLSQSFARFFMRVGLPVEISLVTQ